MDKRSGNYFLASRGIFRDEDYLTTAEAAAILNVGPDTVSDYVKNGLLRGIKKTYGRGPKSHVWVIKSEDLKAFHPPHVFNRHVPQLDDNVRLAVAWTIAAEGTITINPNHQKNRRGYVLALPTIAVSNTERDFLLHFWEMVGIGRVTKTYQPSNPRRRPITQWFLHSTRGCLVLLEQIYDYLPIKKKQAEIVMKFCRLRLAHKSKPYTDEEIGLIKEIRALQHRGRQTFDWSMYNRIDRREKK